MANVVVNGSAIATSGSNNYVGAGAATFSSFNILDYKTSPGAIRLTTTSLGFEGASSVKNGWGGTDTIINIQVVNGTDFDDVFVENDRNGKGITVELKKGDDTVDGTGATDTNLSYYSSPSGIYVDLAAGYALDGWGTRDTLVNVHHVEGGSAFDDTMLGSAGDDVFEPSSGNDYIDGRGGFNTVMYLSSASLTGTASRGIDVDLGTGIAIDSFGNKDTLVNIRGILGSDFNDWIVGGPGDDLLQGGKGSDFIDGAGGYNGTIILANADAQTVCVDLAHGVGFDGYGGVDIYKNIQSVEFRASGSGRPDIAIGGNGNETFNFVGTNSGFVYGSAGNDTIIGGASQVTVIYSGRSSQYGITYNADGSVSVLKPEGTDFLVRLTDIQFADGLLNVASRSLGAIPDRGVQTGGNDTLLGTAANDVFQIGAGNDFIVGGAGVDVAVCSSAASLVSVKLLSGGFAQLSGANFSTMTDVERVQFSDELLALDIQGNAGNAYRLYQAAFNRVPDQPGLSFWTHQLDLGVDILSVAQGFVNSSEFKAVYGINPSNAHIVDLLYQNVLHRSGEPAGIAYWTGQLNGGLPIAQVLQGFAVSSENHGLVDPVIAQGIRLDHSAFLV